MSPDGTRVTRELTRYAEGVDVSTAQVERMYRELRDRLSRRRRSAARVAVAAAAVLVLVAGGLGGLWWLRRPGPLPADTDVLGTLPALILQQDQDGRVLIVVHADGTLFDFSFPRRLVQMTPETPRRWYQVGADFVTVETLPDGLTCRATARRHDATGGRAVLDPAVLVGAGCSRSTAPPITLTRLSPVSTAADRLTPTDEGTPEPVRDPVQTTGVWLLEGTGLLLAVSLQVGPGDDYVLGEGAGIDRTPAARGTLAAGPDGRLTLADATCADTVVDSVTLHRSVPDRLTARVAADPCNRFAGRSSLTWIRLL